MSKFRSVNLQRQSKQTFLKNFHFFLKYFMNVSQRSEKDGFERSGSQTTSARFRC